MWQLGVSSRQILKPPGKDGRAPHHAPAPGCDHAKATFGVSLTTGPLCSWSAAQHTPGLRPGSKRYSSRSLCDLLRTFKGSWVLFPLLNQDKDLKRVRQIFPNSCARKHTHTHTHTHTDFFFSSSEHSKYLSLFKWSQAESQRLLSFGECGCN
jgi:hypothetical protein